MEVVPELGAVLTESGGRVRVTATVAIPGVEPAPLAEGDTLVSLDGAPIGSLEGFVAAYRALDEGAALVLGVERGDRRLELDLTKPAPPAGAAGMEAGR